MSKLNESAIEALAIELFEQLGYSAIYAPDIAPDGDRPERTRYDEVLLTGRLEKALQRINPGMTATVLQAALKEIERIHSPELLTNNEIFHRLLTEGVKVSAQHEGHERGDIVWLIDFDNPGHNEFAVASQFTIIENNQNKRPDMVVFVNGMPLVVIELKNAADENASTQSAFRQLETLIKGMLNKKTLLDLVRHFVVFEQSKKEDPKTGVISIHTVKEIAAYHQYYAVNAAVASTLRAADTGVTSKVMQNPARYGLPDVTQQLKGDKKAGVVWHTQGSGKSLSMVFYTGKIVLALNNPTIVVITDRNDLDDQLFDTFAACKQLLRQEPKQAENRQQLKELLRVASGGVIFTTIQKFQPDEGNVYEALSDRRNIVVIADEAHRTQYGFSAKTVDDKNAGGEVIGKKVVYGFAKYLRDALPNATYLGFTGTPIEKTDVCRAASQPICIVRSSSCGLNGMPMT